MKSYKLFLLSAVLFFIFPVIAMENVKTPSNAQLTQQKKMINCNLEASKQTLKGEERKNFMGKCLKAEYKLKANLTPQQRKMQFCNVSAHDQKLTGNKRKKFMSNCLKKAI